MSNAARVPPALVVLLAALVALGPLTINLYLPAFPQIAAELGAGPGQVQLTMTAALAGLATGHLFLGSLSDAFGRRRPLLIAFSAYAVVSAAIALTPGIAALTALRLVQGVLGAGGMVISMAVVRDSTEGFAVGRTLARLMLVVGVAPVLAPALGSQLLLLGSWRWLFGVLAGLAALLVLLIAVALPESLPPHRRRPGGLVLATRTYLRLLSNRGLLAVVAAAGITMAGQFTYITASAFVFQEIYGLSAQGYGLLFGAGALVVTAGTQVGGYLIGRVPEARIARRALTVAVLGALGIAATGALAPASSIGLVILLIALVPTLGAVGMMFPVIPAMALTRHPDDAGSTAALIGAAQFGMAAVGAPVNALLGGSVVTLGVAMATFFGVALLVMARLVRQEAS
ncbi:MAG TPA: Bcr/CflA family efflux MFS transporter [Actinomycetaceae bacterium]|nr:Bcr/CflA family efflux MFS transporter [Actinomycetaceae bacterium]